MVLPAHTNPNASVLSHFSLTGKTALVTGGCRGIGLQVARGLAEAGAKVAITYSGTKPETANSIAQNLSNATGKTVKAYKCEVTSKSEVESTVEKVTQELGNGRLHILVANAGVAGHIPALEYGEDDFRKMLDINLNGAFWTAQAAAKVFKRQQAGGNGPASIIFTASVSGTLVNIPQEQSAYNASKAGLIHLAKSLAVEWVDFARVNCVSPGYIATDSKLISTLPDSWQKKWPELIPGTRFCDAAELKGAYVFLASEASSYMTGANLIIDGGYSLP